MICPKRRRQLWPPVWLKFLLIIPAIRAFRRKTRTRLSWRLAASHFGLIVWSIAAICIVLAVGSAIVVSRALPDAGEASIEAFEAALVIQEVSAEAPLSVDETNALLKAISTGQIRYNYVQGNTWIEATIGPQFAHIETIFVVGPAGVVTASSDPALIGSPPATIDPTIAASVTYALGGGTNLDRLSGDRSTASGLFGSYPIFAGDGSVASVLVIAKSRSSIPSSISGLVVLGGSFISQLGLVLLFMVGVPAIPIGIVLGIRRARAISRPIRDLALAAQAFAEGDHAARITNIKGEDEVANLQRGFNLMADELEQSIATETTQRAVAEQALSANRDLIANVSHELRTPVALIRGHLEALESEPLEREAYLRIALRETDRLERLVEELFELSRLEAQQVRFDLASFDAGSAVRSAVESLREPAYRDAGLMLTAQLEPGDLTAFGDRLRFEQVLLNLMRNAIRYTPEGGIVLVNAAVSNTTVAVTVRDTGAGIPAEDLEHIFDRFYRADQSRARSSGGAGLGLAIARELVTAMGGSITVESTLDEGTAFTITLPRGAQSNGREVSQPVLANTSN